MGAWALSLLFGIWDGAFGIWDSVDLVFGMVPGPHSLYSFIMYILYMIIYIYRTKEFVEG